MDYKKPMQMVKEEFIQRMIKTGDPDYVIKTMEALKNYTEMFGCEEEFEDLVKKF